MGVTIYPPSRMITHVSAHNSCLLVMSASFNGSLVDHLTTVVYLVSLFHPGLAPSLDQGTRKHGPVEEAYSGPQRLHLLGETMHLELSSPLCFASTL
ncbi:hypothetical protein DPEC_G00301830 [Dallia pectoralis]|uniref:Uncharacterized protein n=1 Tax=Dallia pectoralis TaxID=75939 RepID=A0ACC2FGW4_DALPE|nr:hypothetical protein DPEC_G00301830 [Dallia pectoralis]